MKPDGSWQMTMDFYQLKQEEAAVLHVVSFFFFNIVSLIDEITQLLIYDMQLLIWQMHFFSTALEKEDLKQFAFPGDRPQSAFTVLGQGYVNSRALVQKDLEVWMSHTRYTGYYMEGTMVMGLNK